MIAGIIARDNALDPVADVRHDIPVRRDLRSGGRRGRLLDDRDYRELFVARLVVSAGRLYR